MARIEIDNTPSGEDDFFNRSVNWFLSQAGDKSEACEKFKKSFYSDETKMHLIGLEDKYCEIVAINEKNEERYFRLDIAYLSHQNKRFL